VHYEPNALRMTDPEALLSVEPNWKFYDESFARLHLRDVATGYEVRFPLISEKAMIRYVAKAGPMEHQADVAYRLDRGELGPFVAQMVRARPGLSMARAEEAVRAVVFAQATALGQLKFVPQFEVTWRD
jgi:hypothetical protein